jgi:hypothetical protein
MALTKLRSGGITDDAVVAAALATNSVGADALSSSAIAAGDLPANSILQVVNTTNTTSSISIDTSTFTDTGIQVQITPSATSSKVLLLVTVGDIYKNGNNTSIATRVTASDGSTTYGITSLAGYSGDTGTMAVAGASASFLYSPSTTSQITYKLQFASPNGAGGDKGINSKWGSSYPLVSTTMTAMEIAG